MNSEIINISPQADGRAYITEQHTDQHGIVHDVEYLADAGTDYLAVMLDRAPQILANLRQQELERIEGQVLAGIRAITVEPPLYATAEEAYGYLFARFTSEPDPTKLLKAAQFINLFTDVELEAVGMGIEVIAAVRNKAAEIMAIADAVSAYTPPVGGA